MKSKDQVISKHRMGHRSCRFRQVCLPYSLPQMVKEDIPICNNDIERDCSENVLAKLEVDQHEHCKKSCIIKEYQIRTEITNDAGWSGVSQH